MPPSGACGGPWSAERIGWNLFRAPGGEYSGTRAQGGALAVDDAEFRELFASEYARLCWLGFLLTGSGAEGEELAQEALVRMWWRWRLGRRPADPARYARRVTASGPWSCGRPSRPCHPASGPCSSSATRRTSPRPRSPASSGCP